MSAFAIGVDLGGTNLRASAITLEGETLEDFEIRTEAGAGPDSIVERMAAGIAEVAGGHAGKDLIGIGVGVPGLIRLESGVIAKAPNLPGWNEFPLKQRLEALVGLPVLVENDANAAALGEVWLGAGHDVDDLVLVTLGTGIGGGIVSGGRILHGFLGMAGEIGHMTIDPRSDALCGCGNTGCLETISSGTAVRKAAETASKLPQTGHNLAQIARIHPLSPRRVAQAAKQGDAEACRIFERMGWGLGVGLADLINIFNYPLYLLAGGLLASWDLFAPAMFAEVEKRSITFRSTETRIERARLGNRAGIYGAAYLPIQAHNENKQNELLARN